MTKKPSILHANNLGMAEFGAPLAAAWRRFTTLFGSGYRPERHYMRGPGPKWRESRVVRPARLKIKDPA
jgi:hypothetical protein